MFLPNYSILANKVARLSEVLNSYVKATTGLDKASTAYASAMIGTGTLLVIIPLIIVYLFAQKGFVESLSQSGICLFWQVSSGSNDLGYHRDFPV